MADSVWRGFLTVCPLGGFYGTQVYGRCCMYGPNYVKLSRVFAVQLFSMFIGHYAALPPVRSDPNWSHSHAITASIRLALTHAPCTATPAARDSNLDSGNHDMSRLSALAYPNARPSMASPIYL
jgi:hypothetical protein